MKKVVLFLVVVAALVLTIPALAAGKGKPTPPPQTHPSLGVVGSLDGTGISLFGFGFQTTDRVLVTVTLNNGVQAIVKEQSDNDGNLYGDIHFLCTDVSLVTATDSTGGSASAVPAC